MTMLKIKKVTFDAHETTRRNRMMELTHNNATKTGNKTQFGQRIVDEGVFGCAKAFRNEPLLDYLARLPHLRAVDRFYKTYWFDLWFNGGN